MSPEPPDLDALEHPDEADPVGATPPDRVTAPPARGDGAGVCARDDGAAGLDGGGLVSADGALALVPADEAAAPAAGAPEDPGC